MRDKRLKTALSFLLLLILWAGLVFGGYFYALNRMQEIAQHFSEQVGELKEENQRIGEELTEAMVVSKRDATGPSEIA